MNLTPKQSKLFTDVAPLSPTIFVNDRVSLQTQGNQRVILVQGVSFRIIPWRTVPPKPMPWFRSSNLDMPIRMIWHVASATPLAPYADIRSALPRVA